MFPDQVNCDIFRYVRYHDCLLGIIMALRWTLIGKTPQCNHHNHSVNNCKNCMKPEDAGVRHQVRYCCGTKRILDWFWKVKKKRLKFICTLVLLLFISIWMFTLCIKWWSSNRMPHYSPQWVNNAIQRISDIITKFEYNVRCHWLKEHALSEYRVCWWHHCSLWKESLFWKLKVMCWQFNRFSLL